MDGGFKGVSKSADDSGSNMLIRLRCVFLMYTSRFCVGLRQTSQVEQTPGNGRQAAASAIRDEDISSLHVCESVHREANNH